MARTSEFLKELETQSQSLKRWFDDLDSTIPLKVSFLADLRDRRLKLVDELVVRLLPDLSEASIAKAHRKFPSMVDSETVAGLMREEASRLKNQLSTLPHPDTFGPVAQEVLRRKFQAGEMEMRSVEPLYQEYQDVPDLENLIGRGYGTPDYQSRWYHFQYYRDWKRADEILDQLKLASWDGVRDQFSTRQEMYQDRKKKVVELRSDLQLASDREKYHQDITRALANVHQTVTEKLRVKMKAELEDGTGNKPHELDLIDHKIAKVEEEIGNLRAQREKVSEKMTRLHELRAKISRSNVREVPDEYLAHVRKDNGVSQQTVYVNHHDDWLSTYLLYDTMLRWSSPHGYTTPDQNFSQREVGHHNITEDRYGRVS